MSNASASAKDAHDGHGTEQVSENKRKSRNMSEKKRRDQFNALINDLAAMVSPSESKLDKSSVLKAAVHFLQAHNASNAPCESVDMGESWKPPALSNEEFIHLMLEAVDGFLIAVASDGEILHTSENIVSILGQLPSDLVNNSIFGMLYSTEAPEMYRRLASSTIGEDDAFLKQDSLSPPSSCLRSDSTFGFRNLAGGEDSRESGVVGGRSDPRVDVEFSCHFKRHALSSNLPYTPPSYEKLKFRGFFKTCNVPTLPAARESEAREGVGKSESSTRRSAKNDSGDFMERRKVLIAAGQVAHPQMIREMPPLVDTIKGEFVSRHSLEWKFLFLDHRAPPIIGYLPFELLGTSGYDYYHFDDLERIFQSHETLMETGDGQSCCYRFLTKGQEYIWLQSSYYISYHQWTAKPEFIVCTNRVVSYSEVRTELEREKASEQNDQESVASLNTYRSSPGFSSEASSYCTNKTSSNVGDSMGVGNFVRHVKSPSSSASSTVGSSVAGSDTGVPLASQVVSKQQNLLNSVVGALLEETRLAAAAQSSTTFRRSKSAIVSRPCNETDVDGFREPYAYQQQSHSRIVKQRTPVSSSTGCKRALSPLPLLRPQSAVLPPVTGRSFSTVSIPGHLLPAEIPYQAPPVRSTSLINEERFDPTSTITVTRAQSTVDLMGAYDLPLASGYSSSTSQDGMLFFQQQQQLLHLHEPSIVSRPIVQPHFVQVPLIPQGVVPYVPPPLPSTLMTSSTSLSVKDARSRLLVKQETHQSFSCLHRVNSSPVVGQTIPLVSASDLSTLPSLLDSSFIDGSSLLVEHQNLASTDVLIGGNTTTTSCLLPHSISATSKCVPDRLSIVTPSILATTAPSSLLARVDGSVVHFP